MTENKSLHYGVRSVMAPVYVSDDSTTPCRVEIPKDMTPVDVAAKLRYKNPNVTVENTGHLAGAHEEGHEYNPSDHLSPNLLDAFNHYVEKMIILTPWITARSCGIPVKGHDD